MSHFHRAQFVPFVCSRGWLHALPGSAHAGLGSAFWVTETGPGGTETFSPPWLAGPAAGENFLAMSLATIEALMASDQKGCFRDRGKSPFPPPFSLSFSEPRRVQQAVQLCTVLLVDGSTFRASLRPQLPLRCPQAQRYRGPKSTGPTCMLTESDVYPAAWLGEDGRPARSTSAAAAAAADCVSSGVAGRAVLITKRSMLK